MSQLTDHIAAPEQIATQSQELLDALQRQTNWGGQLVHFPPATHKTTAARWRITAMQAAEEAYRAEMQRLMSGVIGCPPEALSEWLASAQRSTERFLLLEEWIRAGQAAAPLPAAQP